MTETAADVAYRAAFVLWCAGIGSAAITAGFALSCWRLGERVLANVQVKSFADVCREWEK